MKTLLTHNGWSTDQKPVYGGVYRFCETSGLPLEILMFTFHTTNRLIDWQDYILSALRAGMKPRSLLTRVANGYREVVGHYDEVFDERIKALVDTALKSV